MHSHLSTIKQSVASLKNKIKLRHCLTLSVLQWIHKSIKWPIECSMIYFASISPVTSLWYVTDLTLLQLQVDVRAPWKHEVASSFMAVVHSVVSLLNTFLPMNLLLEKNLIFRGPSPCFLSSIYLLSQYTSLYFSSTFVRNIILCVWPHQLKALSPIPHRTVKLHEHKNLICFMFAT